MRIRVVIAVLLSSILSSPTAPAQTLTPDRRAGKMLEAAADFIASQEWKTAVRLLQHLLDSPEEAMAPLKRKGLDVAVSVRAEAERLLREMPAVGRDAYEAASGPAAAELLKQGRTFGDAGMLMQVVRRYLYTAAGAEALRELAAAEYRTGHPLHAALRYQQLLARRPAARWAPDDLYEAAVCMRKAGLEADAQAATRTLVERAGDESVRIGGKLMDAKALRAAVEEAKPASVEGVPLYRVNAERTNQQAGGPAFMEPRWRQSMIRVDGAPKSPTFQTLQKAEKILAEARQPMLPAFFPITATVQRDGVRRTLLIFRSFWGVHAVDMRTGKTEWDSVSNWSLEKMLAGRDARKLQALNQWLNTYLDQRQRPALLFENANFGTLSADNDLVYVVEDFMVPPLPYKAFIEPPGFPRPAANAYAPEISEAIHYNRLQAYNLDRGGKLEWEFGSFGEKHELSDSFFLGPPLPLDGRIYVLTDKRQELRLVCLDPHNWAKVVVWARSLGKAGRKYEEDVYNRRSQAVHLAYGDGVLVVPTNAGTVLGVRLADGSLAWSFTYRDKDKASDDLPFGPFRPGEFVRGRVVFGPDGRPIRPQAAVPRQWKTSAPAIRDGKVVFTAPDSPCLECLRLADGARVWTGSLQQGDLYFAGVYAGKALVVGTKKCRALNLNDGKVAWDLDTGVPSGQGVASGKVYYLPLREGFSSRGPEIAAIDVEKGTIVAHTQSRPNGRGDREVPGNLLFFEGDVVSQSAKEVAAYPQLRVMLARMDERLAKNPRDPAALTERAAVRLDQGDLPGAVRDLRTALDSKPDDELRRRARAALYEALTQLLHNDFAAGEAFLKDYEDLVKPEDGEVGDAKAEARRRRVGFLVLVGRGREGQGKLVEALQAYLELAGLEGGDALMPLPGDPGVKVRTDVWARGRIDELLKKADAAQRKRLEEEIDKQKKRDGAERKEGLRRRAALFGPQSAEGRRARLALARQLLNDAASQVEADLLLQEVRQQRGDAAQAAEAVELLARLARRRGLPADAGYYYRLLGRDFARTALPGGKTGAEVLRDTANDKRLLPYLEESRPQWPARMRAELKDGVPVSQALYVLRHVGEQLPLFASLDLCITPSRPHVVLRDRWTGEEVWAPAELRGSYFQGILNGADAGVSRPVPYFTLGHVVVLPVGPRVFGFDPVGKRVL
jgi:outer membrane protein assembly factor BamB